MPEQDCCLAQEAYSLCQGDLSAYTVYTAYGAESSIIETMSIKFNTTFGDPEEIPQPQITISGSGVSIGDIYYKTEYENWKPGKKVRMEITVDAAQESISLCPLDDPKCRVTMGLILYRRKPWIIPPEKGRWKSELYAGHCDSYR